MGGPACQEAIQIRLCLLPLLGALIGFWDPQVQHGGLSGGRHLDGCRLVAGELRISSSGRRNHVGHFDLPEPKHVSHLSRHTLVTFRGQFDECHSVCLASPFKDDGHLQQKMTASSPLPSASSSSRRPTTGIMRHDRTTPVMTAKLERLGFLLVDHSPSPL